MIVENIFEQNDIELLQNIHIPTKNNSLFLKPLESKTKFVILILKSFIQIFCKSKI